MATNFYLQRSCMNDELGSRCARPVSDGPSRRLAATFVLAVACGLVGPRTAPAQEGADAGADAARHAADSAAATAADSAAATAPAARPEDVSSIEAIVAALYDVISGPAGERDWDRFRSLFLPGARLIPAAPRPDGGPLRVLTVEDYVRVAGGYFRENPFFERESARRADDFGNIAHVFSTYESRRAAEDPEPFVRGINTIQLVRHEGRWWVASIAWDEHRPDNPLPEKYLPVRSGASGPRRSPPAPR